MTVMSNANCERMYESMDWFRSLGVRRMAVNCVQPQGRGVAHGVLTASQMYKGFYDIYRHMRDHRAALVESRVAQQVDRFLYGRSSRAVGCWDFECQAGRTYLSIDLDGQIHACGSDSSNHILGCIEDGCISTSHCRSKLGALHQKAGVTLNCFDCPARRICDHSCPTADYNSRAYADAECLATRMTWQYFSENAVEVSAVQRHIENSMAA